MKKKPLRADSVVYEIFDHEWLESSGDFEVEGWKPGQKPNKYIFKTRESAQAYIDRMEQRGLYEKGRYKVHRTTGKEIEEETGESLESLFRDLGVHEPTR